jgi:preprotein translocase subunit SecE
MATEEDIKKDEHEDDSPQEDAADEAIVHASSPDAGAAIEAGGSTETSIEKAEVHDVAQVGAASPMQLGTRRWVYAGYFAGAIAIAFFSSKVIELAWHRLQQWKPTLPDAESNEPTIMLMAAALGAGAAAYYWYRTRARQLAEEVATEMSKVTWPTRTEVTNGTFVVIVTTIISTVFFALMDRFWGFLTNLVYGGS